VFLNLFINKYLRLKWSVLRRFSRARTNRQRCAKKAILALTRCSGEFLLMLIPANLITKHQYDKPPIYSLFPFINDLQRIKSFSATFVFTNHRSTIAALEDLICFPTKQMHTFIRYRNIPSHSLQEMVVNCYIFVALVS